MLWRDPTAGVVKAGQLWDAAGIEWAATSALSASLLAPMQTEIAPMEIYVPGRSWSDLRRAAMAAGLQEIAGGRLILRFFPTPACARLTEQNLQGLGRCYGRGYTPTYARPASAAKTRRNIYARR